MVRDAESRVVVACQIDSRNASQQHIAQVNDAWEKARVGVLRWVGEKSDFFSILLGSAPGLGKQFGTRVRVWDGSELVV